MSSFDKNSPNIWFRLGFILIATLLAIFFGLISITNSPILIALSGGAIVGLFLLYKPKVPIWIIVIFGLSTPAILDMLNQSRALWAFSMMALLLWAPAILNLVKLNPDNQSKIPFFIWLLLLFVVYSVIVTLSDLHSFNELISGFKRYFQTYGLLVALVSLPFVRKDFDRWMKVLLVIALMQLPFSVFERFVLVPMRGGIDFLGGQATDVVAGTLGANLRGGSPNSVMVVILITAFSFLFARWKEKLISNKQLIFLATILFFPLVLGETKIIIVLLPVVSVVLIGKDIIQHPYKYIPWFLALLMVTALLAYIYIHLLLRSTFEESVADALRYNIGDVGYGESVLNRFTSLTFWWNNHGWYEPIQLLFGHGLGSSYGNAANAGHVAQSYPGYGIGLTTVSSILWDLGCVGLLLYISIYIVAWAQISKLQKVTTSTVVRADCIGVKVCILTTMMFLLYSNTQINLLVHELIIAMTLGYGAFMIKEHHQKTVQANL